MSFEEALIEHCSPTLAGIKPASLYRVRFEDAPLFAHQYKMWRAWFSRRGMNLLVLKGCRKTGTYLLYLYREAELGMLLARAEVRGYLHSLGYETETDCRGLLRQLARRLCLERDFPHEIGIFLGYPLEDVQGFIAHAGRNYTCCGFWKAYGDPEAARQRFSSYQICTDTYKRRYAQGVPVTQLIVA